MKSSWRIVQLGDISSAKTGSTNSQDACEDGAYILFDRSQKPKRSDKYLFDEEAIIIPGEGKEFIPRFFSGKYDLHQRCYSISDFAKDVEPRYIYYQLLNNAEWFSQHAVGSTVRSLRRKHFIEFPITLPPFSAQKRISLMLSMIDNKIDVNRLINDNLAA